MRIQATVVGNLDTNRSEMSALIGASQGAAGALEAAQAGNQLLALQAQQLGDLTAAIAAQGRAQSLEAAARVIPAALITGLRSDLPGQVSAQVTENVYDTPTGGSLLIPQGARLIGIYDSQISFGQSRLLLVWTRLILPNGYSIVLERQPGADETGQAGLEDGVDHHWGALFKAALLSTFLAVGTELGADQNDSDIVRALRRGAGDTLNQAGQQVVRRNLNIQPTLTIRPGFPVRVIVTRDLMLQPYRG